MTSDYSLSSIASHIEKLELERPLLVGIDGMDCAGKSNFAHDLMQLLVVDGRHVVTASIDCFHNTREHRYKRGEYSPEGYFEDGYDYGAATKLLLEPIHTLPFPKDCCIGIRDSRFDIDRKEFVWVTQQTILLCDGVFLFRCKLNAYWDYRIFVKAEFETCLQRALTRDIEIYLDESRIRRKYEERYIPAQQRYLMECRPLNLADVIVTNDDPSNRQVHFAD